MMLELGVAIACVNGYCNHVGAAYYAQYPMVKKQVEQVKDNVISSLDPKLIRTVGPLLGFVYMRESTIDFEKNKSLTITFKDDFAVKFVWGF